MLLFKLIHLLSVMILVGGMFFAHMMLRSAAIAKIEQSQRLCLLNVMLLCFFKWIWAASGAMLAAGFCLLYLQGGITHASLHVTIMLVLGLAFMLVYGCMFFSCYVPFSLHVSKKRSNEAEVILGRIRKLVAVNLVLLMAGMIAFSLAHLP